MHVSAPPGYEDKMTVHVIAKIGSVDDLHRILDGWQEAMQGESGADWLGQRLREAGVAVGPSGDPIADERIRPVGSRSSILARSWVAMLSVAMSLSSSIMLPAEDEVREPVHDDGEAEAGEHLVEEDVLHRPAHHLRVALDRLLVRPEARTGGSTPRPSVNWRSK